MKRVVNSVADLSIFAAEIADKLPRGSLIGLSGELGAGKTEFVRALAEQLKAVDQVQSPTYTIEHRYKTESGETISHWDLYRLNDSSRIEELFELAGDESKLILIEWPEKIERVHAALAVKIEISVETNDSRIYSFSQEDGDAQ